MVQIPMALAFAGQTIALDVFGASGVVLVRPGVVLTKCLIDRLGQRGVKHLHIRVGGSAAEPPRATESLVADVTDRFAGHEQDGLMMALMNAVVGQVRQASEDLVSR